MQFDPPPGPVFTVADLRPFVTIRANAADLTLIREAIDRALRTGESETTRPVLDGGMLVKVVRDDAPIAITSPEQAESLYGSGWGAFVGEQRRRFGEAVFIRVPVTEPPSS